MDVGVQSVVFGDADLEAVLDSVERLDLDAVELWGRHLSPASPQSERQLVEWAEVSVAGYGVVDLEEPEDAAEHVRFADEIGAGYVTVNYPPTRDDITEELVRLGAAHDIDVAIHNYSSVHHDDLSSVFSSLEDVRTVLNEYEHPRLGVCIDTGHFLVMDESPEEALETLGERTIAVHLKDTSEAEIEDIPGAGALDLPRIAALLEEHTDLAYPPMIEYELEYDAEETLRRAIENVRAAF